MPAARARRPGGEPGAAHGRGRAGFALPAAIFFLVAVSLLLLDLSLRSRAARELSWSAGREVGARMAARAGVAHALVRLRALGREGFAHGGPERTRARWNRLDDEALTVSATLQGGGAYRVALSDGSAKLPLNDATEPELRSLFLAAGASPDEAEIAAQSVLDWRDADDLHRGRGAEWDDYYRTRRLGHRPRNGPFATVAELANVRGLDRLYPWVSGLVTVSGAGRVNLNTAPPPVLRALPGFTDEAVRAVVARRESGRFLGNLLELEPLLSAPAWAGIQRSYAQLVQRAGFDPGSIEIVSTGWVKGSPLRSVSAAEAVRLGSDLRVTARMER